MNTVLSLKDRFVEYLEYRPVKQAQDKLGKLEEAYENLVSADRVTAAVVRAAKENLADVEARALIDEATEADVRKAREELENVKTSTGSKNPALQANLRAQQMLRDRIETLQQESRDKLARAIKADYVKATRKLAEAMEEAARANAVAADLFEMAQREFPGSIYPGVVTETPIGLQRLAWSLFQNNWREEIRDGQPSEYARWRDTVRQFLAEVGE